MGAIALPEDFADEASGEDSPPASPTAAKPPPGRTVRRRMPWGAIAARLALCLSFVGIGAGLGVWLGFDTGRSISLDGAHRVAAPPYDIVLFGQKLEDQMTRDLAEVNAERSARHDRLLSRDVLLEYSTFERSAGGVVTRGSIHDLAAPRTLRVVIDAFDATRRYVASGASLVVTGPGSTSFSAEMPDADSYASFGVRFLDGDHEVHEIAKGDPLPGEPPLLMDDAIYAADYPELEQRLASLGYVADAQSIQGDPSLIAVLGRFRRDHRITGPVLVTVGDLLALRAVSNTVSTSGVDLTSYH